MTEFNDISEFVVRPPDRVIIQVMHDWLLYVKTECLSPDSPLVVSAKELDGGDTFENRKSVAFFAFQNYALYWACMATAQTHDVCLEILEEILDENV